MLDVRQRNQVLGTELGRYSQLAVGRKRHMKNADDVVQLLAVDYSPTRGVDNSDFRIRWRPEGSGIRIDVRAIDPPSIGGQSEIARTPPGQQSFDFLPAIDIDHGNVVTKAIRNVQRLAALVGNDAGRFEACGQRTHDLQRRGIDHRYRV